MSENWLSAEEQSAWRAYLTLHREVTARLNRQLQSDSQLSITDYEVLVVLSEAPEGRLRPFEMARFLKWEQSRLSHHLTRMERRGLVQREECCGDGRGAVIGITRAGQQAIEEAAPAHAALVRKLFFGSLTAKQVAQLESITSKALAGIDPNEGCPDSVEG